MNERIIFLDYDGVINIDPSNFNGYFDNPEAIRFLNKLCKDFEFEIVVTSSWRQHPEYKNFLYDSGLYKEINIIGGTEISNQGREFEIKNYLNNHPEIEEYLIIDDAFLPGELCRHLIQTTFTKGFNENKYKEALSKMESLYNKTLIEEDFE